MVGLPFIGLHSVAGKNYEFDFLLILLNSMDVVAFYVSKINLSTFGLVPSVPSLTHLDLGNAIFKIFPHIVSIRKEVFNRLVVPAESQLKTFLSLHSLCGITYVD